MGIFFLLHLGNCVFVISVNPKYLPFNCWVWCMSDPLMSQLQLQGYSLYMCPILGPTRKPDICPRWMDVGWNTGYKGYTSPFYDNLRTRPQGTSKTDFHHPKWSSFNRLQSNLQLFWTYPSPSCKDKQCAPLRLIMESLWSMTQEPSIFRKYTLGGGCLGNKPFRWFWTPPSSQDLKRDTQLYLCSSVASMFIQ
jgi:hypothetical protein